MGLGLEVSAKRTLVEGQHGAFRRAIVGHARHADIARSAGDRDHVPFVPRNHVRQERLGRGPVAQHVDVEHGSQLLGRRRQDGVGAQDACVVDENARAAERGLDLLRGGTHSGRRRDVARVELDVCVCVTWSAGVLERTFQVG